MKKMLQRPAPFLLIALLLVACDYTVDPKQGSTVDINVRLGNTQAYIAADFFLGTVTPPSSRDYVFTIENIGYQGNLILTGSPAVQITSAIFTITTQPAVVTLAPGASTTFTLRYTPPDTGTHTAVLSIPNNDLGETNYQIYLLGSGGASVLTPVITGTTPAHTSMPTWTWMSGGGGSGTYRFKLDSSDLTTGATETTALAYTPSSSIPDGNHTLYIQEQNYAGTSWSASASYTISVVTITAVGWIGDGSDGWKTTTGATSGSGYQSFERSRGVFNDTAGNIYIADSYNHRVCKWDAAGNAVGWIGGGGNGWKTIDGATSGSGFQSFNFPSGVYVDASGNIYVSDHTNYRICKWDAAGNAIGWIGGGSDGWQTTSTVSSGTSYQHFSSPLGIYVDGSGNIYVADSWNDRIVKWNAGGTAVGWIGGNADGWQTTTAPASGQGYREFEYPNGVCIDSAGFIYVADTYNHRICKWDSAGNAIGWIGGGSDGWQTGSGASYQTGFRGFLQPTGVVIDAFGNLLIADWGNSRICKWDSAGNAIGWIGRGSDGWQTGSNVYYDDGYQFFAFPSGLYVDVTGNMFIADTDNNRISVWHQY